MACPQDCPLHHQGSRAVLPHYRAPVLGRYERSSRRPVLNAIPVETYSCDACPKRWSRIEQDGETRWTEAISGGSFRGV